MTRNTRVAAAIAVILALGLWLAFLGFRTARTAEVSRIAVVKKRAALRAEIQEMESVAAGDHRARGPLRVPRAQAVIGLNPKVAALSLALYRTRLARRYRLLYQTLGLSPAQIAEFENLLTTDTEELIDLDAVASADGLDSGPEIAALRQQENDNFRAAEIALLGDAGYQQLQQFNRVVPVWNLVNSVEKTGFPPEPLTDAQAQQLSTILTADSSSYQNGGPARLDTIDWDAALAQTRAEGILSADQLAGLQVTIDHSELLQLGRQYFQGEQGLK